MHKNLYWIYCLLFCGLPLEAQNLVPNPGFEENSKVPYSRDQLMYAISWRESNAVNLSFRQGLFLRF